MTSAETLKKRYDVNGHKISIVFDEDGTATPRDVAVSELVVAGWTGRDPAAVEKHIAELEKLGVRRPATTPIFYRVAASRLTVSDQVQASGTSSSGEIEFVLLQSSGRLWVGVGSDHTDREVETYGVTVSKQMCDKPIAPTFWLFDTVAPHWDKLQLRAHIVERGRSVLYQEGSVAAMLDPRALIAKYAPGGPLREGTLMFCGTLSAKGGVRSSPRFSMELEDPVLGRTISHRYDIQNLPILG